MFYASSGILVKSAAPARSTPLTGADLSAAADKYRHMVSTTGLNVPMPENAQQALEYFLKGAPVTAKKGPNSLTIPGSEGGAALPPNRLFRKGGPTIGLGSSPISEQVMGQLPFLEAAEQAHVRPWLDAAIQTLGGKYPELQALNTAQYAKAIKTPEQRKALMDMVLLHEGAEQRIGRKIGASGARFASHVSPQVLLQESELARALPSHLAPVRNFMRAMRAPLEERSIRQVMPSFRYGVTPVSRGMRKGLTRAIEAGGHGMIPGQTLQAQKAFNTSVDTARRAVQGAMDWLNKTTAPYMSGRQKATDILGNYLKQIKF